MANVRMIDARYQEPNYDLMLCEAHFKIGKLEGQLELEQQRADRLQALCDSFQARYETVCEGYCSLVDQIAAGSECIEETAAPPECEESEGLLEGGNQ